ncbi:MAG: AAA family ATPase [Bacteroidia bacterium]|nr:AAA family ATPase [Bacteroidia bacterium]MBP7261559.1 AAA family ATPase [Bacteroidia bacterium]MBP9179036.1 AAA family ATPase [Bacteroidia bacterium]MBP9724473.1 AAA family ATPase [Bacteroidia bacterium]
MKLTINNFGIRNYKSFDDNGVHLYDLSKINIVIGKNNSGKSNILKFLSDLHNSNRTKNKREFPSEINTQHKRNGKNSIIRLTLTSEQLKLPDFNLIVNFQDPVSKRKYMNLFESKHTIDFNLVNDTIDSLGQTFNSTVPNEAICKAQSKYNLNASRENIIQSIKDEKAVVVRNYISEIESKIIYIPDYRFVKEGQKIQQSNLEIDGSNIISKMFSMQNPELGSEKERENFFKIQELTRNLLNIKNLRIEIPASKKEIIINCFGNRLPLESYGTGIHQLILLCCALTIHNNNIVCIEEPEIHLHPELQRKFINFLKTTENVYFISTHSNVFMDFDENVSIYHVSYDGDKSIIDRCDTSKQSYEILNNLGYKTSDLLQSNGVIWVEGPSDRLYLKKWIEFEDPKLIEGIHYSIMFYGGRLLSHLSLNAELVNQELIPLLRINRNSFVLMDKDRFNKKGELNATKMRIIKEIGENRCWITKGKEIENYISENLLKQWLEKYSTKQIQNISWTPETTIDEVLSRKKMKFKYSSDKVKYSKEISALITIESLNHSDLKKNLKNVVDIINQWNYNN